MQYRISTGERIFKVFNIAALAILALIAFYPFWYVIVNSLQHPGDVSATTMRIYFWPSKFFAFNYWVVFAARGIVRAYLISILRVGTAVPAMLLVTSAAAYVLSRREMLFRKIIIFYFFITMFFAGGLIPYYMTIKAVGLLNRFLVYVIPVLFHVWTMIIMKTSIQSLPEGLVEAALMDGGSHVRIYLQIILPLSKAMLAVLGLFSAVGHWNDWFVGAFFIRKAELKPLQTFIQLLLARGGTALQIRHETHGVAERTPPELLEKLRYVRDRNLEYAFIVCAFAPVVVLYPFLQRFFVKGVLIGSIKE